MISQSDRVLALGHGLPQGLLGFGRLIVTEEDAEFFDESSDNIYIWCNADCYVRKHHLRGFATGMFISEPLEARLLNVEYSDRQIKESNELFVDIVSRHIDQPSQEIYEAVKNEYYLNGNGVCEYNHDRLQLFA